MNSFQSSVKIREVSLELYGGRVLGDSGGWRGLGCYDGGLAGLDGGLEAGAQLRALRHHLTKLLK
jgi:hypothetical protein